jgi:hypothetical protein
VTELTKLVQVLRTAGFMLRIFLFTTASTRPALGPTQPPIQWVPGALSLGVKRPRREAEHSPPSSAEVKGWVELYLYSPNTPSWRGAQLRHRDKFIFTLLSILMRDFGLSRRWRFEVFWVETRYMLWLDTNVSDVYATSIFRVKQRQ